MLEQITPVVATYNEAPNIARTISALTWATDIVVVDSFSSDTTVEILETFPNVRVVQRTFDNHAAQWNYAIQETQINTDWILAMDADWVMSEMLRSEIAALVPSAEITAYAIPFNYYIYGQPLRGSLYPPVVALYRRGAGHYQMDGHGQWVRVTGNIAPLRNPLWHDDRKSLSRWLWAQSRYARLEADWLCATPYGKLSLSHKLRRLCLITPWLMPLYYLTVKGGLLDGRAGLVYALQRTAVEALIAVNILTRGWDEARTGGEATRKEHGY